MRRALPCLALVLALAASAATGAPVDPAAYEQGGEVAYRRVLQAALKERKLNADRAQTARVRTVANRIVVGAPAIDRAAEALAWTVNVVTDPAPDVVEYPGGRLLVTTSLVQAGLSDEELAAVLAHVIAHGLLGHDRARIESAISPEQAAAADPNERALAVARAVDARLRREADAAAIAAADRASVELLARAVYDPRTAAGAWKKLGATRNPLVERYPVTPARLAALEAEAQRAVALYEDTRAKAQAQQPAQRPPRSALPQAR